MMKFAVLKVLLMICCSIVPFPSWARDWPATRIRPIAATKLFWIVDMIGLHIDSTLSILYRHHVVNMLCTPLAILAGCRTWAIIGNRIGIEADISIIWGEYREYLTKMIGKSDQYPVLLAVIAQVRQSARLTWNCKHRPPRVKIYIPALGPNWVSCPTTCS